MRRLLTLFFLVVFLVSLWMTYDNVWSDGDPTRALAEAAACRVKDCKKRHMATTVRRMPEAQTFEFTWEDGMVSVSCHRAWYVAGEMRCEAP
jgi:hypothetical protein